jgi:hypothetical protein
MFRKNNRIAKLVLSAALGFMAFNFVAPALAQTNLVPMCYRNRNIQVPSYLVPTYVLQGGTQGTCSSSPR